MTDQPHDPAPGPQPGASSDILERIVLQMTAALDLNVVLTTITEGLVDELEAAFARIWLLGGGDLCGECYQASDCSNRERCLHLKASAGLSTNLDGEYRRIPLGALKIGRIAQGGGPVSTNDVLGDERLPNKAWIRENGLRSFAGYPLLFKGELLGVVAMFGRRAMIQAEFDRLAVFANQAAIAIKNAQLFAEVEQLKNRLQEENLYLREEIKTHHNFEEIVGRSPALTAMLGKAEQVARTDATVLIQGETGTGKELVARAIHQLSPRKHGPLVKVNCAAIPANLVESELFGHEKGAFTGAVQRRIGRFELAQGGTIFLDEIGDLPQETQVKVLRVLQEREFERVGSGYTTKVDVRVIAATNRNLKEAVEAGGFRADLFYRLNVFPLELPPLRERAEDVPALVANVLARAGKTLGKRLEAVSADAMSLLASYRWPGNIRELQNVIERAAILAKSPVIRTEDLPYLWAGGGSGQREASAGPDNLEEVERVHIRRVLETVGWVVEGKHGAAQRLGLHPNTLRSRMQKLGIRKPGRAS
jgi:transcriptional regulator with GAF, ATPase, and Fis domain